MKLYQITNRTTGESVIINAETFTDGCESLGWKVCECWYTTDLLPEEAA